MPSDGTRDPGELGTFLRARRERVTPADVGLPAGGRRRTPGLRREELAMLAGISVDYLVRLEQGRDQSPSASVLASLSAVLRLGDDERLHLTKLAAKAGGGPMCPSVSGVDEPLSATVRAMVDRLHPMPAFVLSNISDLLAWNPAYDALMRPTGMLDREPPNVLRYTFLDPQSRAVFLDWEALAIEQVRNLRAGAVRCTADSFEPLVGELSVRSADFARLWARHDVGEKRSGTKRLAHPVVGDLTVEFEALTVAGEAERRLVTYVPADDVSAARLDALIAGEGVRSARGAPRLRVVGDD
jgi:transcriptional regulator with XRE-family HTH domain